MANSWITLYRIEFRQNFKIELLSINRPIKTTVLHVHIILLINNKHTFFYSLFIWKLFAKQSLINCFYEEWSTHKATTLGSDFEVFSLFYCVLTSMQMVLFTTRLKLTQSFHFLYFPFRGRSITVSYYVDMNIWAYSPELKARLFYSENPALTFIKIRIMTLMELYTMMMISPEWWFLMSRNILWLLSACDFSPLKFPGLHQWHGKWMVWMKWRYHIGKYTVFADFEK